MLNADLKKQWAAMVDALASAERFYSLNDNYAIKVELEINPFLRDELKAFTRIYERTEERRGDVVEVEWDCIDLEALPAALLGRVVEVKLCVERWNQGELVELPPSNTADFLAAQNARWEDRRRRRVRARYSR